MAALRFSLLLALAISLAACGGPTTAPPRITTGNEFSDTLDKVQKMTEGPLTRYESGQEPTDKERADLVEAARLAEGLINYKPNNFSTYMLAGKIYMALGEFHSAEVKFRDCISAIPEDAAVPVLIAGRAQAFSDHGAAFEKLGAYEEAAVEYQKALEIEPNNPNFLSQLASANLQIGSEESLAIARASVTRAMEIDPKNPRAMGLKNLLSPKKDAVDKAKSP